MKIHKAASGKTELRLSKTEWEAIGKKAGWTKVADEQDTALNARKAAGSVYNCMEKIIEYIGRYSEEYKNPKFTEEKARDFFAKRSNDCIKSLEWFFVVSKGHDALVGIGPGKVLSDLKILQDINLDNWGQYLEGLQQEALTVKEKAKEVHFSLVPKE
jgi:hypothetical protein